MLGTLCGERTALLRPVSKTLAGRTASRPARHPLLTAHHAMWVGDFPLRVVVGRKTRLAGLPFWETRGVLRHPAERLPQRQRGRFERLAERASFLASSPPFFALCFGAVLAWAIGLAAGADNRFLTAISGGMTALTLGIVALVKNAEMRSERAIQQKLDAIAAALLERRRGADGEAESDLEDAIGLHDEI